MQPDRPPRTIGSWLLHVEYPGDVDRLQMLAHAATVAANVLAEADLLSPRTLHVPSWLRSADRTPAKADLPATTILVTAPLDPADIVDRLRAQAATAGTPGAEPFTIEIHGPGQAIDAHGVPQSSNLFGVEVLADGAVATVSVDTYSDTWLSHGINGQPQPALAAANAPRLRAVLRRLAEELGTDADPGEPTKYAVPVEDGLDNHRDADGEPIATEAW